MGNVVKPKFEAEIVEKDEKIEELAKSCQEAEAKIVEASFDSSKETIEKLESEKLVSEKEISELKETIAAHLKSIEALKLEKQEEKEELNDELQFVKEREVYLDSVVKNLNQKIEEAGQAIENLNEKLAEEKNLKELAEQTAQKLTEQEKLRVENLPTFTTTESQSDATSQNNN